ncbi:MAG: hypothetical protein BWX44_01662 [Spirochaetes bacterium ADurb.Bin001]|nr:MAG: hypothetical protein BWX44_01662 [Spirochaetes bacterium ADurb.Bin001]
MSRKNKATEIAFVVAITCDDNQSSIFEGFRAGSIKGNNAAQLASGSRKCLTKIEALIDGGKKLSHGIDLDKTLSYFFLRIDEIVEIYDMTHYYSWPFIGIPQQNFYRKAKPSIGRFILRSESKSIDESLCLT